LIRNLEDEREEREREIAELRQKNLRMTLLYNKVGSHGSVIKQTVVNFV